MEQPLALRQMIVFALDELRRRNGHHDFESLCQEVIRQRIASNLITSTGPVSAAGDQGRDAETYFSYLPAELGASGVFLARVSDSAAAFCCTIQREGLTAKFIADAKMVIATGQPVERIYAFCTERVPAGTRHGLEEAITANVELPARLHDGNWLAEQLAQADLFWVAERYLSIPADYRPIADERDADKLPDWYLAVRSYWQRRSEPALTEGDFRDLIRGLRESTDRDPARADLPFWMSRLRAMLDHAAEAVARRVRYELVIAHALGQRDLRPADDLIRAYFRDLKRETDVFRLFDGSNLAVLASQLAADGKSCIRDDELLEWRRLLACRFAELLAEDPPPTRASYLWFGAGLVELHDPAPEAGANVIQAWLNALDNVGDGSIFPLPELGAGIERTAPRLAEITGWADLTARFDEVSALTSGRAAAAANAYRRAEKLHEAGRIRLAIAELHRARVDWYAGETLFESVQASLTLANCYGRLGLMHASKQFALSAAFIADTSDRDDVRSMVPNALELAATTDFVCGRWFSALPILIECLHSIGEVMPSEYDPEMHAETVWPLRTLARIVAAARDLDPALEEAVAVALDGESLRGVLAQVDTHVPPQPPEWWQQQAEAQLRGPLFADAASRISLTTSILGLQWTAETDTGDPEAVIAAERLMALAEVLLTDLSEHDLCLMPGVVELDVRVRREDTPPEADTGEHGKWDVELMPSAGIDDLNESLAEALGAIMAAVSMWSLLPHEELHRLTMQAMQRGLLVRLVAGRTYDELATYGTRGLFVAPPLPPFVPISVAHPDPHPDVAWQSGPGLTYSRPKSEAAIRYLYSYCSALVPRTLNRLAGDAAFAGVVRELRSARWLDWHLMQAVASIATDADDAPVDAFTTEVMNDARRLNLNPMLDLWNLELKVDAPDWSAVERFLADRYGYFTDDVPHEDPFPR